MTGTARRGVEAYCDDDDPDGGGDDDAAGGWWCEDRAFVATFSLSEVRWAVVVTMTTSIWHHTGWHKEGRKDCRVASRRALALRRGRR